MHSSAANKNYQILEHTADLKIRAFGKSQAEVFSNILKGMFETIKPQEVSDGQEIVRDIKIKSQDIESLLVDFLSEALYLSDVNNEAYFQAEFEKLTEKELAGKIKGRKIKRMQLEIKAVTYHSLEIKKEKGLWQVTVLFDI
jgi:SHS2 domain-containing protein